MIWACGWWVSADPQVCSTAVSPMRAPSRAVMTEDVRHLDRRPQQRPRLAGHLQQEIVCARHLANRSDGDAGVKRRRVELLVSDQNLDDPDIGLLFQEMRGKAVPQR